MSYESYIHAAAIGTSVLAGVTGRVIERSIDPHRPESAGNRWHRHNSIRRHKGGVNLITASVKDMLDRMPQGTGAAALDLPCVALGASPLYLWTVQNQDDVPLPTAGSTHELVTISKGVLVLKRLTWSSPGEPTIATVSVFPLSADGLASFWTLTQGALPAAPPVDADYTLKQITIDGGAALTEISDIETDFELPARPRFKAPASRYQDAISLGGTAGLCGARIGWKTTDATLMRTWGDGYKGSAIATVELQLEPYAQAAERDTDALKLLKIEIKGLLSIGNAEGGRPNTYQVSGEALSADGTSPVRWGY